jgi:hypothetical protein
MYGSRSAVSLAIAVILGGCAIVDQYSGRAVVYNLQAEQAQDQALLLNIVRAYLRRPMQFTTVSSITGTANASGGAQYVLPTNVPLRPATNGASIASFPPVPSWTFSGSMSGGPAFNVPVLDTQEFYQGILKPIPAQTYDLYLKGGYPRDLLFNLFIQKVVMKRADPDCPPASHERGCEFTFDNYVGTSLQLELFQALGDYLIAIGLTTEAMTPRTVPFRNPHNLNVRYVGAPGADGLSAEVVAPPGGAAATEGAAAAKAFGICFAPRNSGDADCIGGPTSPQLCAAKHVKTPPGNWHPDSISSEANWSVPPRTCRARPAAGPASESSAAALLPAFASIRQDPSKAAVIASAEFVARLVAIAEKHPVKVDPDETGGRESVSLGPELGKFSMKPVVLTFSTRSVEQMIYYLGEVVRRQTFASEFERPRDIYVKWGISLAPYPEYVECSQPDRNCVRLFVLNEGVNSESDDILSVNYGGRQFSVPRAAGLTPEAGLSPAVLEILRQQLAVNSSAKSLPQSSVISVVGQ